LYGCETWSVTLRNENRLRVFEKRVLRRIFETKWQKNVGSRRRLHNEVHHDLYASPNIIRLVKTRWMRWAGNIAGMRAINAYF